MDAVNIQSNISRYEILPVKRKRNKTEFIILSHIRNFHEIGSNIPPSFKMGSYKHTSQTWEYYFCKEMSVKYRAQGYDNSGFPYHYFIEQVGPDYQITMGAPEFINSYYLDILIKAKIIPMRYANSILIGIGEDLSFDIPENRLWDYLSKYLISPLIQRYTYLNKDSIVYIDELINQEMVSSELMKSGLTFDYTPAIYFDMHKLRLSMDKYAVMRS